MHILCANVSILRRNYFLINKLTYGLWPLAVMNVNLVGEKFFASNFYRAPVRAGFAINLVWPQTTSFHCYAQTGRHSSTRCT